MQAIADVNNKSEKVDHSSMKIAYVVTRSDSIGGAQVHVRDVALGMRERGHETHIFVGGDGPYFEFLDACGLTYTRIANLVRPLSPAKDIACILELRRVLKQMRPDVVHSHSSKAGILGRLAAASLRQPNVFSAHGWSFTEGINPRSAAIYKRLERWAAGRCNRILLGCESDRRLGLANGVGDEQKLQTIWYGLPDLEVVQLASPSQQPPRMVMVARFEEQKDHATLVDALGRIRELPWSIDLLGDGPLRPSIEQRVNELGLGERVHFLGARPTADFLRRAQIFLLITNWEGLPLAVLEAMRMGLPVIGSRVGGIPEQVLDGENGYVVPRGDVSQLSEKLQILVQDAQRRHQFGIASRARFLECFQAERMLDKIEQVYQSVISKP